MQRLHAAPVRGAQILQSTTPISFSLVHGLPDGDDNVLLQMMMDHRILDGLTSHRIVRAIGAAMKRDIVAELAAAAGEGARVSRTERPCARHAAYPASSTCGSQPWRR